MNTLDAVLTSAFGALLKGQIKSHASMFWFGKRCLLSKIRLVFDSPASSKPLKRYLA